METDESLYAAWARGDAAAGGRLIDRYLERIGRFFANKVLDAADTEDLVGQTFELCARSLGRFRCESGFRTYLFGIAKNALRDYIKKKGRRPGDVDFRVTAIHDLGPSPSVIMGERREQVLLLEALRRIPLELQIVIELSFFEEMTQAEIAGLLELPAGTVASRIRRGKQLLFERIEAMADSPELLDSTLGGLREWATAIQAQLGPADDGEPEP